MRLRVSLLIEGDLTDETPIQRTIETAVEALRGVHYTTDYTEVEENEE